MTLPRHSVSRAAFTLIELLTVIAIIGVLAAILIPTVSAVRIRARTAVSVSNLHQLGLATHLFANDNKGGLPIGASWWTRLYPYVYPNKKIDTFSGAEPNVFVSPNADYKTYDASNGMNPSYGIHGGMCGDSGAMKVNAVGNTNVILFADVTQYAFGTNNATVRALDRLLNPGSALHGPYATNKTMADYTAAEISAPIALGPDAAGSGGWLRYPNGGSVAVVRLDGSTRTIKKGQVIMRDLMPN